MVEHYIRRLPVYLILDVSESMAGPAIEAVEAGVKALVESLRSNPMAMETAYLSVITFARKADVLVPLTEIMKFIPPKLSVRAGSALGAGLRLLLKCLKADVQKTTATLKGDYKPLVFLLTDGQPTDDWEAAASELKRHSKPKIANMYAICCGPDVNPDVLNEVSDIVLMMNDLTSAGFRKLFMWLSASMSSASIRTDGEAVVEKLPEGLAAPTERNRYDDDEPRQVFLTAMCQKNAKPYLMRFARRERDGMYEAISSHSLEVFDKSDAKHLPPVNTGELDGIPSCAYCENPGAAHCECKTIFCNDNLSKRKAVCPACRDSFVVGDGGAFDVNRSSG